MSSNEPQAKLQAGHDREVRLWPWFLAGSFGAFIGLLLFVDIGQKSRQGIINQQKMWEYYLTHGFSEYTWDYLRFDLLLSVASGVLLAGIRWGIWKIKNRKALTA